MAGKRQRGYRQLVEADIDLMPMMNLFVAIIPMLLISAVFLKVTVIDMDAPAPSQSAAGSPELMLSIAIKKDRYVVEWEGSAPTTIDRGEDGADKRLADVLSSIVAGQPARKDVIIVSEPSTRYADIVAVMDISRASGLPAASLLGAQ